MMKRISILLLLFTILLISAQAFAGKVEVSSPAASAMSRVVSIEIKDQPLVDVMAMLFKDTDVTCKVDTEVAQLKVTAVLKNVSLGDALRQIASAAGVQAYSHEGVWHISPAHWQNSFTAELERKLVDLNAQLAVALRNKTENSPDVRDLKAQVEVLEKRLAAERGLLAQQMAAQEAYSNQMMTGGAQAQASRTQVFVIKYINPAELPPLIYALGAKQVTVVSGGKLVVSGTAEVIADTEEIIRQLDTEEALPRSITVQIFANYTVTDGKGKKEELSSVTVGSVPEGQPIKLQTFAKPKNDDVVPYLLLDIQITPGASGMYSLALTGGTGDQITLTGTVSIPALAEAPQIKMGEIPVAVSVKSGSEMAIAQGAYDINGGRLEFHVSAKITIGKERLRIRSNGGGGTGGFNVDGVGNFGGYGREVPAGPPPPADGAGGQTTVPPDAASGDEGK